MAGDEPSAGADDEDVGEAATSEEPAARDETGPDGSPSEAAPNEPETDAASTASDPANDSSADGEPPEEAPDEPDEAAIAEPDDAEADEGDDSEDVVDGDDDSEADEDTADGSVETGDATSPDDDDDGEEGGDEETDADGVEEDTPEADGDGDDGDDADGEGEDGDADEDDDADDGEWGYSGYFSGGDGPEEDREMPLAEHIEEMLKRLAVVVAIAGAVSLVVLPFADQVINFLWYSIMPGVPSEIARPRVYGILEKLFTEIKVASLAGIIVALPVLVYQTYAFMRPGLYPHERRYYLAAVPTSLVLALVGVSFAFFVILPAIFTYFLYYSQDVATIGFALGRTFDLILLLMGYMALVFQIPLFLMLAMMMGLVTRRWLAARRLLFWGAFLGISFLFSPDPTGMAPIVVAATMIVLFEGTLLLTKWTGRE